MWFSNAYKGLVKGQSWFDYRFACWANNHCGWAKAKKLNRRIARKRIDEIWRRNMSRMMWEDGYDSDYDTDN